MYNTPEMNYRSELDMPLKDPDFLNILQVVFAAVFAAIGGLLGHLMRTIDKGHPVRLYDSSIETLAAGFFGAIAMLACISLQLDIWMAGAIAGTFGWVGARSAGAMLKKALRVKLGIKDDK